MRNTHASSAELHTLPDQNLKPNPLFRQVLEELMHIKRINQRELAARTGFSQPHISRVERGAKPLTEKLAKKLSEVLCGTPDAWMEVYELTSRTEEGDINQFLNILGLEVKTDDQLGSVVRKLQSKDIIDLFGMSSVENRDYVPDEDLCEMTHFSEGIVRATSYDLTLGHVAYEQTKDGEWIKEPLYENFALRKNSGARLGSLQHIKLPNWLEAEINPPASLALKGLLVSHGPIIDPGWDGIPLVFVHNPTEEEITISLDEPFLTLRFWQSR